MHVMSKMLTRDNSEGVQERGVRVISPGKGDDLQFSPGGALGSASVSSMSWHQR